MITHKHIRGYITERTGLWVRHMYDPLNRLFLETLCYGEHSYKQNITECYQWLGLRLGFVLG